MNLFAETFPTPLGKFSVAVDDQGALVATAFGDGERLAEIVPQARFSYDDRTTSRARNQVLGYFAGKRKAFDLELAPKGTDYQRQVWESLRRIPFGKTRSYGELAADCGNPAAARAAGSANGANPLCVVIPCHRVINADGTIGGFAFGPDIKRALLELEGSLKPAKAVRKKAEKKPAKKAVAVKTRKKRKK